MTTSDASSHDIRCKSDVVGDNIRCILFVGDNNNDNNSNNSNNNNNNNNNNDNNRVFVGEQNLLRLRCR